MISPSKLVPLSTIFDGVGLDINNYVELIEEYGFDLKTSFDRKQILKDQKLAAMYARLGADIEKVSRAEYELLVGYIKQNNLSGKFAIVDIGWSGGMQRYLSETLDMLKIDHSIKGYYIGVADYYKRNIEVVPDLDLNGYLFDFLHDDHAIDKRSAFVGLFETLFLEQGGSVKNYWNDNGVIKANRLPYEYAQYSNKMAVGHKKVYNYRLNNPNSGCTVKDVQNGINSLRNIKYIKSKLIVDGPAITNALNWHIWSNNYNLINFIYSASSINKYEKEYNSALRDLKLYAPKVLRHSEIGFKTKLSILLRTFFPITFIKRDNKKAKLAYEKDTME